MAYSSIDDFWKRRHPPTWTRRVIVAPFAEWCRFGVRDPSLLVDADGAAVREGGRYVLYFNGRDRPLKEGGQTVVGRATSADGVEWEVDDAPVFEDGRYAAQGSVVRLATGDTLMFYSYGTNHGFRVAELQGTEWVADDSPILGTAATSCRKIGLPYVTRCTGTWSMVFEGIDTSARFAVYGASSTDLRSWQLLDGGEPLLRRRGGWDELGQANPSLHVGRNAVSYLVYNGGRQRAEWDVGLARASSGRGWESAAAPILQRVPSEPWSTARLEGGRPFLSATDFRALLYFGTATPNAYDGAAIGLAELRDEPDLGWAG